MSERRFAKFSAEGLEKRFDESRASLDELQSIRAELFQRKTKRARNLLERVAQAISVLRKTNVDNPDA